MRNAPTVAIGLARIRGVLGLVGVVTVAAGQGCTLLANGELSGKPADGSGGNGGQGGGSSASGDDSSASSGPPGSALAATSSSGAACPPGHATCGAMPPMSCTANLMSDGGELRIVRPRVRGARDVRGGDVHLSGRLRRL